MNTTSATTYREAGPPGVVAYNNGSPSLGKDSGMDGLLSKLDRLIGVMEKSSTTVYQRRLNTYDIANPGPIGLFAFALSLALFMTSQAHITEQATQFIGFSFGIFLGGLILIITGFLELLMKNSLGATAFCTYGAFWITVGFYGIMRAAGIFFIEAVHGQQALVILIGLASVAFFFCSFRVNGVQPVLFINLAIMFFLLAWGFTNDTAGRVAGWWGIITACMAFYGGTALLFRDMWGRDILPQFYFDRFLKDERVWFPRARGREHDVEDGDILKRNMW